MQLRRVPDISLFLSSPSDMQADREVVLSEIRLLSDRLNESGSPKIGVIRWPEDIGANAADYAQAVINSQSSTFELFVGLVGVRMGTPTPRANSGTEEEFDRAIELLYGGHPVQVLMFFSNIPQPPHKIDAYQLMLVKQFRDKTNRLGVLSHTYKDRDELEHFVRVSLAKAYESAIVARKRKSVPRTINAESAKEIPWESVTLGNMHFSRGLAPQWASCRPMPLAGGLGTEVRLSGRIQTSSPYFRLGFKYADCREPVFSTGSVQTPGQNILIHVGKNQDKEAWFLTVYRAGIRLGLDRPLSDLDVSHPVEFCFECGPNGVLRLKLNGATVFETFFQIDGISGLAILAWGDEHEFACDLLDVQLLVRRAVQGGDL